MELVALIVVPFVLACVAYVLPHGKLTRGLRPMLLPIGGSIHLILTIGIIRQPRMVGIPNWIELDPLGRVVILVLSVLFFGCFFVYAALPANA